jgi:ABC-type uncharacterized transport system ATPase subunit
MVEKNDNEENEKIVIFPQLLTKSFGNFVAVENLSFQVRRGEIFALIDGISLFDGIR